MKKWKRLLAVLLCLAMMQVPAIAVTVQAETTTQSGLTEENGQLYYYYKGTKVTNKWKTVDGYRYYFGKNGAAYKGSKIGDACNISVKTINGKIYGFDVKGHMVKGTYVTIKGNFYVFSSKSGACDVAKTQNRRKAAAYKKNAATLRRFLGTPKKTTVENSCYQMDGKDVILTYAHFTVTLFRDTTGKEIVLGASPR